MKTTIDRFGRVVIPKKIRDSIGLNEGSELSIEEKEEQIILRPFTERNSIELIDGVLVFTGQPAGAIENQLKKHREQRLRELS